MKSYIAFSNDKETRYNASSGGFVYELLKYLLQENIVDGVLIVKQNYPHFYTDIAENADDLKDMQGSVYAPIDYQAGLKKMQKNKKYAIVGIPCQIHKLPDNVFLKIGLFCSGTPRLAGTKFFLKRYKIKDVISFKYRGKGWPGKIEVKTEDSTYFFDRRWSLLNPKLRCTAISSFKECFFEDKCFSCNDKTSQLADISTGDAWSESNKLGSNFVIARSQKGEKIVQEMYQRNIISLQEISSELINDTVKSKRKVLFLKLKRKLVNTKFDFLVIYLRFIEDYIIHFPIKGIIKKILKR